MATSKSKEKFLSAFERRFPNGQGASWVGKLRHSAIEKFAEMGLPTTRHEDWKYTNIGPVGMLDFAFPQQNGIKLATKDLLSLAFVEGAQNRLVFIDGIYSAEHSSTGRLPAGMRIESFAQTLAHDDELVAPWLARYAGYDERSLVALNTAFMEDGAVIVVPKGCRPEEPVYLVFIATAAGAPVALYPRNLVVCGETSEISVVESYAGLGAGVYFANAVTEIAAAAESVVHHYRLQREGNAAFHVGTISARLQRAATLVSHQVTLGGGLVRNDIHALLDGEGSECSLNGLYVTEGDQHVDNHTEIDHAKPRSASRELYKGILRGRARGVFNGRIVVREAAQKTDARQTNRNLLLSKDAVVNSKPQLEIHADDVKCSHGSTIGQLDPDALFYLRARGIGADEARRLLSYGFAAEVLSRMKITALRERLEQHLLTEFGRTAVLQ